MVGYNSVVDQHPPHNQSSLFINDKDFIQRIVSLMLVRGTFIRRLDVCGSAVHQVRRLYGCRAAGPKSWSRDAGLCE